MEAYLIKHGKVVVGRIVHTTTLSDGKTIFHCYRDHQIVPCTLSNAHICTVSGMKQILNAVDICLN